MGLVSDVVQGAVVGGGRDAQEDKDKKTFKLSGAHITPRAERTSHR